MVSEYLLHALHLLQTGNAAEAERQLRLAIQEDPNDPEAYALLAVALCQLKRGEEALDTANQAVHISPENPMGHYAAAVALHELERYEKGIMAVREALRLDSQQTRFHALLSQLHLARSEWKLALEAAEAGLEIDAEDETCVDLRSIALVNLGRRAEATIAIDDNLRRNPENPTTHANQGWSLLHAGQYTQALDHFREALRLEPNSGWARQGIIEALRARNPIYGLLLRYFLWMLRLSPNWRMGVVFGALIGMQIIGQLLASAPYLVIVVYAYYIFAYLTWTARPLFDLLLRLDPYGRMVLQDDQIQASNLVGLCLLAALGLALGGLALGTSLLGVAFMALVLVIPAQASFLPGVKTV